MKLFTSPADMIGNRIIRKLFDLHDDELLKNVPYKVHSDKLHNKFQRVSC